jgi:hypothetical protein
MGIVIPISRNFFDREMPQLELNSMVFLVNLMKFRIFPYIMIWIIQVYFCVILSSVTPEGKKQMKTAIR